MATKELGNISHLIDDDGWTEPESAANTSYQPVYPYNNVKQTEAGHLFEMDDVELEIATDALDLIADQAIARGTGARGLRAIMEEILLPVMYEVPSRKDVGKVIVTAETIREKVSPTYIERGPNSVKRSTKQRGEEKSA